MSQIPPTQANFGMFVRVNDSTYLHVSDIKTISIVQYGDMTKRIIRVTEYSDVKYDSIVPADQATLVAQTLCQAVNAAYLVYYAANTPTQTHTV